MCVVSCGLSSFHVDTLNVGAKSCYTIAIPVTVAPVDISICTPLRGVLTYTPTPDALFSGLTHQPPQQSLVVTAVVTLRLVVTAEVTLSLVEVWLEVEVVLVLVLVHHCPSLLLQQRGRRPDT